MKPRPSICYAAPGHALVTTSGSARNVLSLAQALASLADVTVAFRAVRQPIRCADFKVVAIDPEVEAAQGRKDDVAATGLNPFSHIAYLRTLTDFCAREASSFDLVLEKGWRMSGFLAASFAKRGVPAALVENDVRHWSESVRTLRGVARYGAHNIAQCLAAFYSRRVPLIIAETDELKAMLAQSRGIASEKIEVVGLGVDHALFRPLQQASSRLTLGIKPESFVLLYVGGMDTYHDLSPVLDGLGKINVPFLELHLVGDGALRREYEIKASAARVPVRFHGQVPHESVPEFIAAADLCIAPYRVTAFPNDTVCFSTLKIPEYMACARPVVSVPSGNINRLIEHERSGFLLANDASSWCAFLQALPSRERLKEMGWAAYESVKRVTWERAAKEYLAACEPLIARNPRQVTTSLARASRLR